MVDRSYAEPVGRGPGDADRARAGPTRCFAGLPADFAAYGGHKEAVTRLPPRAVQLATSPACPVQAFRIGRNVYATQFHPELDIDGLCTRIDVYKHAGYFAPERGRDAQGALPRGGGTAPDDPAGQLRLAVPALNPDPIRGDAN